jgi:hypothetical protein
METKLAKCSHCGAKKWNIVGANESGCVLMEGDGKTFLVREAGTNKAMTALLETARNSQLMTTTCRPIIHHQSNRNLLISHC